MFRCNEGLLDGSLWVESPNKNERPDGADISLLVIHNISLPPGKFGKGYVERFFCNALPVDEDPFFSEIAQLKVSAHLFIDRLGKVTQFVPLHHRAWHAGVSQFENREACNDFSIGIELEGTDDDPYTQAQYETLIAVTRSIQDEYPAITLNRIVGHCDIAPERKTDPGSSFDWEYYRAQLDSR